MPARETDKSIEAKELSLGPIPPMEALLVEELPDPPDWYYEPKWDGFRAIVEKQDDSVEIWSKSGKPLGRYFPEILAEIRAIAENRLILDGELVIPIADRLSFDALQARLHPAASRIAKLSTQTAAQLVTFECLAVGRGDLSAEPLVNRRNALERLHANIHSPSLLLSPFTTDRDRASEWLRKAGGSLDGVIAKPSDAPYRFGERAMRKVKQLRTADCVIGGYRKTKSGTVASLLLGLFNRDGLLDLVGFSSAFPARERATLAKKLKAHEGGEGFTGKAPSGPSRWNPSKTNDYVPLRPSLVAEVIYDQVTAGRFRHGTKLLRWRPDKAARQCTFDQLVREIKPAVLFDLIRG